ncbi:MAG TPA: aryl-sulfate sulfotransferase [Solirubrobacterales bacterium]|nr:aryl-sulfate sulfotransferase [Solirubrobacterales bacterium]
MVAAIALAGCAGGYTSPAKDVSGSGATARGIVFSTVDATVTYWFEYGPTQGYGDESPHRSIAITDRDNHPVSEVLSGLDPGTTYHYRLCARDGATLCAQDKTFTTIGGPTELAISADPALSPDFDPNVSDYVTRCGAGPVNMDVVAPGDTTVSVDGSEARNGTFSEDVALDQGERFTIEATGRVARSTYHVRCLPDDFPAWSWESPGDPSANFYITMPRNVQAPGGGPAGRYIAIFDDHGAPVWWMESSGSSDAKLLDDDTLAWGRTAAAGGSTPGYEIHRLDGSLVRTWRTVGTDTDIHDFELLANGNALVGSYKPRAGTQDLTEYGGPATGGTPIDAEFQEVRPNGTVAWSWNSKDHIDLSETPERWRSTVYGLPRQLPDGRQGFDWIHWNSIQKIGNTLVVSFRHLDAVYAINMTTGNLIWKLGGTPTPDSLDVIGDPESNPLGGQHYARVLPNGNMTLYDNNTNETAAPRGAEYRMNLFNGTATLVDTVNDPDVPSSPCCGSAAKLGDGSWLVSWGGTEVISEFGPGGNRHFKLQFVSNQGTFGFSYRVDPIVGGSPTIGDLRTGMDAMP